MIAKHMFAGIITIYAAGAILNLAGSGSLGSAPQKFAQFITKGYGV